MYFPRNGNKYNAQKRTYRGVVYHSAREAAYAADLDIRVMAGELREWRGQIPFDLMVNGVKICRYTIDFLEIGTDGKEVYTEVKPKFRSLSPIFRHPQVPQFVADFPASGELACR